MRDLRFEWDERKESENRQKHGVSFEEAETVFSDEWGLFQEDPDHSEAEERFLLLGMSSVLRLLVVAHCYRKREEVIRIISARLATTSERKSYFERWRR